MEQHKNTTENGEAQRPRVPIKTYKWEDIRRDKIKGGYPWTYLNKEPFSSEEDYHNYLIMEQKKFDEETEGVLVAPIVEGESTKYVVITELPLTSELDKSHHSITKQTAYEEEEEELNLELDEPEPEVIFTVESAESSDNISQYLDKEEYLPTPVPSISTILPAAEITRERAKSEEPKLKRKLSIDSSYSRKSLSKLGILKKLKEAKEKLQKFHLPTLPTGLKPKEQKENIETTAKEVKKTPQLLKHDENPVYIHIPLNPPDVEEYSSSISAVAPAEALQNQPEASLQSLPVVRNGTGTIDRRFSGHPDEIVAIEILKTESIDLEEASKNGLAIEGGQEGDIYIIEPDPNQPHNDDLIIIMPEDSSSSKADTKSIKSQRSIKSQKSIKSQNSKKVRAKSVEPERKRKLSIDSSYSRRSLSKLGLMKKLKNAKENIISTFTLSSTSSKKQLKISTEEVKEVKIDVVAKATAASGEPKYIYIPLKPPVGQHDEYSHLENESIAATLIDDKPTAEEPKFETKQTEPTDESSIDSPIRPKTDDVQFIFLTPPSDDEILDGPPEIPETPSSESNFFEKDELKSIAKGAVDKVSPDKTVEMNNLDDREEKLQIKLVVDEEDGLAISKQETTQKEVKSVKDELKSSLKTDSPILKKKVSFKRRSRDDSKDGGIYEDVKTPDETKKEQNEKIEKEEKNIMLTGEQSMSVDEEKSYLDEKIMKSTSLEEDFNRWSKLSDHDYEPINPPPEVSSSSAAPTPIASSTVHVIDSEPIIIKPISTASSITSLERRMLLPPEPQQPEEPFSSREMQLEFDERFASTVRQPSSAPPNAVVQETKTKQPGKIEKAFKDQAGKFKTKLHGIKKPNIKLPNRPKFEKPNFKFETPKIHFPKMPDTSKITFPSFSLPRKNNNKKSLKQRQYSTESNAGGTKTHYFDFSTYPRMFKKKQPPRDDFSSSFSSKSDPEPIGVVVPEFATVPKTNKRIKNNENDRWGGRDSIRVPLHGDSMETKDDSEEKEETISEPKHENQEYQQHEKEEEQEVSHIRYEPEIDIDDAYEKENQQIHTASPFSHAYNSRWNHGSFHPEPASTLEFKENFRNQQITDLDSPEDGPTRDESFEINTSKDIHSSESSLGIHRRGVLEEIDSDEFFLRQKGISQDNIEVGAYLSSEIREAFKSPGNALSDLSYAAMASNQSLPETPTKRKQIKKPKRKKTPHVSQEEMPYQDSEPELDDSPPLRPRRKSRRSKKRDIDVIPYQETIPVEDVMESNSQLNLHQRLNEYENEDIEGRDILEHEYEEEEPPVPPRKHRSLKSLDLSEHDSILGERHLEDEEFEPPVKPPRTLSRSSSKSHEYSLEEQPPVRPIRTRSHSRTRSRAESLSSVQPCLEEPCTMEFRDYMGYSTIDKTKREPPLPPSTPRRKKSISSEKKFFTVPRKQFQEETPVRPLRNYSTLGPSRPPRKKNNLTDEEKHQESLVDITQYIEIEEESNRDLHSGKVIQKMKDRPLPAPPRPPRKSRTHDNTPEVEDVIEKELEMEIEMQTDAINEKEETKPTVNVQRRLIAPTNYSYEEETITHGSLVVEPLNGAKILSDSELTRHEKTISITKEYDDEDSEIPEEFYRLKPRAPETQPQRIEINPEVEVLKAQKLQVSDLDVDRLSVNELLASKIVVSEIESKSIQTNEINTRTGALKVGEIELPPSIVQQLFERLQVAAQEQVAASVAAVSATASPSQQKSDESEQKKTPFEQVASVIHPLEEDTHETSSPVAPENEEKSYQAIPDPPQRTEASTNPQEAEPLRPPRQLVENREEPEVDDEPPPRPPHPEIDYTPSQPPASFYALRAQQFVDSIDDDDIPMPPRRRRHHKATPIPESSSDDDSPIVPPPSRRRVRSPEPSIPQLTGQLIQACGTAANYTIKRLMTHITNNVLQNSDRRQDLHVMMVILLILIAGLILLGFGNGKTVHYHHWEYFNPPRDM